MPTIPTIRSRAPRVLVASSLAILAACGQSREHARADSATAAAAAEQQVLASQLAAQKDSLISVVLDADRFISQVDSQVSRVKDLPTRKRSRESEGVLQDQLAARQDMLFKVDALVKRAQTTARLLAESKRRESGLRKDNGRLRDSLNRDQVLIAQLGETIQRQTEEITGLQATVTELTDVNARLGEDLRVTQASSARAYYIVGREEDLLKKGVIVREGGMNLLVGRVGKTVQPARRLDPALFTPIDTREVTQIPMPDSTRKYRIVSRQSLDDADVKERDRTTFRGNLTIADADRFWSPSRYLIVVER